MSQMNLMELPLNLMESLHSWMMHELLSPASAIQNGIELHGELDGDDSEETWDLIGQSAAKLSCVLQMFRIAFGEKKQRSQGSSDHLIKMIGQYLSFHKITLHVESISYDQNTAAEDTALPKVLCLGIFCLSKMFPRGGEIRLGYEQPNAYSKKNMVFTMLSEHCKPQDFWLSMINQSAKETNDFAFESPAQALMVYFLKYCHFYNVHPMWKTEGEKTTLQLSSRL